MSEKRKEDETMQLDANELTSGVTIQYVLLPSERPTNPEKLWRGKITATFIHNSRIGAVQVESLETGYEGCDELVHLCQIRAIEPLAQMIEGERISSAIIHPIPLVLQISRVPEG